MSVASSQLWTKGTNPGNATSGMVRIYIDDAGGFWLVDSSGTEILANQNISGAANPVVTTNPIGVGILYTQTTSGTIFTCTDATTDSNVWIGTDGTSIP